jgi:hypothetical protein
MNLVAVTEPLTFHSFSIKLNSSRKKSLALLFYDMPHAAATLGSTAPTTPPADEKNCS